MPTRIDYPADNSLLETYCARLGLTSPTATLDFLSTALDRQIKTIAFENIDVQNGKGISIEPADIVQKVLLQKRGGYCYELNGLFALVLQALGIEYSLIACRPLVYPVRRPKTHMAIIATIDGNAYLIDTGFGANGPRAPIALSLIDQPIEQGPDTFQLTQQNDDYTLSALIDNQWATQYSFNTTAHELIDFAPANYMNSTHPDVLFTQKLIALIFTDAGRKVLAGNEYREVAHGERTERKLSQSEVSELLASEFYLAGQDAHFQN